MKTLVVKDLPFGENLDRNAMAGVRGGDSQLAIGEPHPYAFNLDEIIKSVTDLMRPWSVPVRVDLPASL